MRWREHAPLQAAGSADATFDYQEARKNRDEMEVVYGYPGLSWLGT